MSKFLYPIFKLPNEYKQDLDVQEVPLYIKWWLYNHYKKSHSYIISEIITGNPLTLNDSVQAKFPMPPLPRGNSEQDTAILPTGYTQLDYIESTGTQYIDTGYTPVQGDDFEFKNVTFDVDGVLFSAGTGDYQLILLKANSGYFKYFQTGTAFNYPYPNITNGNIKITNGNLYYNDTLKAQSTYGGAVNTTLNIFRRADNTTYISAQIGEIIISNNGTIKRDFISCKNASNEVGLYDLVTKTFFGNNGTGTFTAGNTVTIPNPDFEVPIQNVTGDVEVKIQNKNLAYISSVAPYNYNAVLENGECKISGTSANAGNVVINFNGTNGINLKANETYKLSVIMTGLVSGGQYKQIYLFGSDIGTLASNGTITNTITPTVDRTLKNINLDIASNVTFTDFNIKVQLEYGTTASTYTPHKEQTFLFPLGTQRMYLGDYLADDGIHHVRAQEIIDENLNIWTSAYGVNSYVVKITNRMVSNETDILVISTHFKGIPANQRGTAPNVIYNNTANQIEIRNTEFETLNQLKTWLENNNVTIEYILEQEEITPYTTEQQQAYDEIKQALSYEEQTNISGSSDESNPLFAVQYYMKNESEGE